MDILTYVKPELLVVAIVLYFLGIGLKKSERVRDEDIPILLWIAGILLCGIYVFAVSEISGYREVLMAIFTSFTQGLLVAGLSMYVKEVTKTIKNKK